MDKSYATQIALTRLSSAESQQVVQACLSGTHVSEALMQQIVAKAAGNPFFLEELARTIGEQGARQGPLTVPDTIQAVLTARLDRLPSVAKRVLQAAAVIGREIPFALLAATTALPAAEFSRCFEHLQSAEFLQVTHHMPESVYTFTHMLIQDAALQTLLPQTLRYYNQQIAHILTTQYPDTATQQPALVAHDYTEAGDNEHAIVWWQRAGQWALERSAYSAAMHHCSKGLELLSTLPDAPERLRLELELTITLGHAIRLSKGNATPEVEQTFARAWQLCQQVGESLHLCSVLGGLRRHYLNRGELQTARQCGEQLLHLAQRTQDPFILQDAHYSLGITRFWLGEGTAARMHLEHGMALVDPQRSRSVH
jgi:predicted ATPase